MSNSFDMISTITANMIPQMVVSHIVAAIRYTRNTSLTEVKLCSANNIDMVLVAEWGGNRYSYFTASQGKIDAIRASAQAQALGMPKDKGIYFCGADFDANDVQIAGGIHKYMEAVANNMTDYRVGVYGNGAVCKTMLDEGFAEKSFVWGAIKTNGTSEYIKSNEWSIRQHLTTTMFGVSVDPDDVQGDYWGWQIDAPDVTPVTLPLTYLQIQHLVTKAGFPVAEDGIPGPKTKAAIIAFQKKHRLTPDGVVGLATIAALRVYQ